MARGAAGRRRRLPRERRLEPASAHASRRCSPAPRRSIDRATTTPRSTSSARRGADRPAGEPVSSRCARSPARPGRALQLGDVRDGARRCSSAPAAWREYGGFSDVDRADLLFRLGVCRYKLSSISTALALFGEALKLAEGSEPAVRPAALAHPRLALALLPAPARLGGRARGRRARARARGGLNDRRGVADAYFLASIVAEREGHWVLARSYAERAKALYEEIADRRRVGRLLNNLGGLNFLLGKPERGRVAAQAVAFGRARRSAADADAAQAVSSLAQVHLRTGEIGARRGAGAARARAPRRPRRLPRRDRQRAARARPRAARAGPARRGRGVRSTAAEASFAQLSSPATRPRPGSPMATSRRRRGDDRTAARLYRRAAEALQDFRF